MKAGEGVAFCPPMGGGLNSSSPTPWPVSFFSSLNEGIRQTLSAATRALDLEVDSRTAVGTGDKGRSYKQKLSRIKTR